MYPLKLLISLLVVSCIWLAGRSQCAPKFTGTNKIVVENCSTSGNQTYLMTIDTLGPDSLTFYNLWELNGLVYGSLQCGGDSVIIDTQDAPTLPGSFLEGVARYNYSNSMVEISYTVWDTVNWQLDHCILIYESEVVTSAERAFDADLLRVGVDAGAGNVLFWKEKRQAGQDLFEVEVLDVRGRRVAGGQFSGLERGKVGMNGASTGIYFYRVRCGQDVVQQGKLLVMRE
ncbi:MAG: hypothetical protein H6581_26660 [Bacteroidia bacterium]|nr:hypothetical protein [Bacteroidia bacterium]